ncbi:uncharacterized protein STEHIDRAFT_156189 [Stereum hirsutum FP-91666 SS1]|uniref:uncharacterized protein n=1 Tax=Stereum hirsutum (strain FP-91666) TaxID=721885 RepID=UPI0004409EB1|nr:uncharacterized protein STEHIDRAFT_156189 [Stereum hirsutum FP-91666 SS1]EIM87200.1 hypothetical protein STEHIDRAFT_156189 [Stereum hirsutum FP-91666 SS1]
MAALGNTALTSAEEVRIEKWRQQLSSIDPQRIIDLVSLQPVGWLDTWSDHVDVLRALNRAAHNWDLGFERLVMAGLVESMCQGVISRQLAQNHSNFSETMKLMSIIGRAVDSLEYPLTSSQKRFIVAIREHWKDMVESLWNIPLSRLLPLRVRYVYGHLTEHIIAFDPSILRPAGRPDCAHDIQVLDGVNDKRRPHEHHERFVQHLWRQPNASLPSS